MVKMILYLYLLETEMIQTSPFIKLPIGFEAQIRPGGRITSRKGISIPNSSGAIYVKYRINIARHKLESWDEVAVLLET